MESFPKFLTLALVKQIGNIKATGTFDISDIILYRMNGAFYARTKSTLTGKRFRNEKAFEGSRRSCERFKRGNQLASQVYQTLQGEQKFYKLFCRLKREAILLLKRGKSEEEVLKELEIISANPQTPTCHLNLSLPATTRPVLYRHWYKQTEKVYEYNYDNHKCPTRKQAVVYFEGSEHLPLNLSTQDILDITEGTEEDMLNVIKKLEERLAMKQKQRNKIASTPVVTDKLTTARPKGATRKIVKPVVLRPRWTSSIYYAPPAFIIVPRREKQRIRAAPV